MKLSIAYHCHDCQEIFARAPHGVCPRCMSREMSSLSWLVKSAAEREEWFDRIRGGARRTQGVASKPAFRYSCPSVINSIKSRVV